MIRYLKQVIVIQRTTKKKNTKTEQTKEKIYLSLCAAKISVILHLTACLMEIGANSVLSSHITNRETASGACTRVDCDATIAPTAF